MRLSVCLSLGLILLSLAQSKSVNSGRQHLRKTSHRDEHFDVSEEGDEVPISRQNQEDISALGTLHSDAGPPGRKIDDTEHLKIRSKKAKKHRKAKKGPNEQERGWHYCSSGAKPKDVREINVTEHSGMGYMCGDLYPSWTCCYDHDLNLELVGDKILEQIPEHECARMLMKLRCAHCSPRSWWLFHAPDKARMPHKRVLPIMCPAFCRRFHRACRNSVAGLEGEDFCDYHTTDEEGPCFPDTVIRRGTID